MSECRRPSGSLRSQRPDSIRRTRPRTAALLEALEARVLFNADLSAQLGTLALPAALVPGDSLKLPIIVSNLGDAAAQGTVQIKLYASANQQLDEQSDILLTTLSNQKVKLAAANGQTFASRTFKTNTRLSSAVQPGNYFLIARVEVVQGITDDSAGNDTDVSDAAQAVVWKAGEVAGRIVKKLTLTQADPVGGGVTAVSVSVKGPGTVEVVPDSDGYDLIVTGGSALTTVSVSGKGGDNRVDLDDLTANGSLRGVTATTARANGLWTIPGDSGVLSLGQTGDDFIANLGGASGGLSTRGNAAGLLAAASFKTIAVKGDASLTILAGADLGDGELGNNDDSFAAGAIESVKISGAADVVIRAGVDPVSGDYDDGDDAILGDAATSYIRSMSFGSLSDDSIIQAPGLPARFKVGSQSIDSTQDDRLHTGVIDSGGGALVLREAGRFVAQRLVPLDPGPDSGSRKVTLTLDALFDDSDAGTLEDTFLVYVVNADDPSQTLLDRGTAGTAVFALAGDDAQFAPGLVLFDDNQVTIDLTTLGDADNVALLLQLINSDGDDASEVTVTAITETLDEDGSAAPALVEGGEVALAAGELALDALSLDDDLAVLFSNVRFDADSGLYEVDVRLRNDGDAIGRRVAVFFDNLPQGVSVVDPSGIDNAQSPYINFRNALPTGGLASGETSRPITVALSNPDAARFELQPRVHSGGANQAPVFETVGDLAVLPGGLLEIELQASDPDGDVVTFALISDAALPTGSLSAGVLTFAPTPQQVGEYQFTLVASDGSAQVTQSIALSVEADPDTSTRISGRVLDVDGTPLPGVPITLSRLTVLTDDDGYFTLELPSQLLPTEPFAIDIPLGDPFFDPFNTGTQTISFRRARFDTATGTSEQNPRRHTNLVSSFIDASIVYGSDEQRAAALRTFSGGRLKTSDGDLMPLNSTDFFPDGPLENDNNGNADPTSLFVAGDVRASENVALASIHVLLLREHNRLADEIAAADPQLSDEEVYQRARRLVGAIVQHITYDEYLPVLLGEDALAPYAGYDAQVDPQTGAFFTTAAFRLGHTQMVAQLQRLDAQGNATADGPLSLRDAFFSTAPLLDGQMEDILRGLVAQTANRIDTGVIDELRNFLFGPPGSGGMDLPAMNLQRGRDLGLPSYTQARIDLGLSPVTDFDQITSDVAVQQMLEATYGTVDQIDAFIGGIAEDHAAGALVGPLFKEAIKRQFERSRDGDRYWYENSQFTAEELQFIRGTGLAALIERNTTITGLSGNLFTSGTEPAGPADAGAAAADPVSDYRSITGAGNNLADPDLGSTGENLRIDTSLNYADGISAPAGADRPGARVVSNGVMASGGTFADPAGTTALAIFWGQILSHDLALTPTGTTDTLKFNADVAPINGKSYPFVAEKIDLLLGRDLYEGVNNVIARPIYLPGIDTANGDMIDPQQDVTIDTEAIPGATVFVEAGTLEDREGNPFAGLMSITQVPADFTPASLPDNLFPSMVVTIQPADMVFTTPAPLSLPNTDGLPAGAVLDLWSINPVTGQFDNVGQGMVSDDGSVIETISGGIRNSSWHFFAPPPPEPTFPDGDNDEDPYNSDPSSPDECVAEEDFSSKVELQSGVVIEEHFLPTYQSLGTTRGVRLVYDSLRADPRHIVNFSFDSLGSGFQYFVANMSLRIEDFAFQAPGYDSADFRALFRDPDANPFGIVDLRDGDNVWRIPGGVNSGMAALVSDLSSYGDGVFTYTANAGPRNLAEGLVRINPENGARSVITYQMVGSSAATSGRIANVNRVESAIGAGWGIAGVQEVVQSTDGLVLLIDGDGSEMIFEPGDDPTGPYVSPDGDQSVLLKLNDGTFQRTLKDQTVYRFDLVGRLVEVTSRTGRTQSYSYDGQGRLTTITDPAGLQTTLAYDGVSGKLKTITDPAGRVTELGHDAAGNLLSVTDPDDATRTWSYDSRHKIIGEVDQAGRSELTFYDASGRAIRAQGKDGAIVQIAPMASLAATALDFTVPTTQVRSLSFNTYEVVTFGSLAAGAKALPQRGDEETFLAQPGGNVVAVKLDSAGMVRSARDTVGALPAFQRVDGKVMTAVNARGNSVRFEYDMRGNVLSVEDDLGTSGGESTALFADPLTTIGATPFGNEMADLNGDGNLDLVTSNGGTNPQGLSVLLGNGDGTFSARSIAGNTAWGNVLRIADITGDGKLDAIGAASSSLRYMAGNGDGTFGALVTVSTGVSGSEPTTLTVADFDGDGDLDVASANAFDVAISILLNNGDGTFATPLVISDLADQMQNPRMTAGDLDGDDDADLVLVGQDASQVNGSAMVLLNNGNGSFAAPTVTAIISNPSAIRADDLDGDGDDDLVVAGPNFFSSTLDTLQVIRSDAGALVSVQTAGLVKSQFPNLRLTDLDNDQDLDIVSVSQNSAASTFLNNGSGTFGTRNDFAIGMQAFSASTGDLNGDGFTDVAIGDIVNNTQANALVLLGRGDGTFDRPTDFTDAAQDVALADFDGDGDLDLAATTYNFENDAPALGVALGNGDGTFQSPVYSDAGVINVRSIVTGDFNGDTFPDVVYSITDNFGQQSLARLRLGNGDGTFAAGVNFTLGEGIAHLVAADFNGDGDLDLAASRSYSGFSNVPFEITLLFGNGDGTFAAAVDVNILNSRAERIAAGDLDGDDDIDLVVGTGFNARVVVLMNNGDGTFADAVGLNANYTQTALALADIDNDDDLDIISALGSGQAAVVHRNAGNGTFPSSSTITGSTSEGALLVVDVTGDGNVDLITEGSGVMQVLAGDGSGGFGNVQRFALARSTQLASGDIDSDGKIDIAYSSATRGWGARLNSPVSGGDTGPGKKLFTYDDTFNQLTSFTDELGRTTLYELDPNTGRVLTETHVVGDVGGDDDEVIGFTYTADGQIASITDALGVSTTYTYNNLGRLTQITYAAGTADEATRLFEYDLAGNETAVIDELGRRVEVEYDARNRVVLRRDPDLNETLFEYDARGKLVKVIDALQGETTYEYDEDDHLVRLTDPIDGVTQYVYDDAGRVVQTIDPLGRVTQRSFDARGRVVSVTDPGGATTRYTYDDDGNVLSITDALGNVTRQVWDARNRLIRSIDPLGKITTYDYNGGDDLVKLTDANGRITRYSYDDIGRLTTEEWVGGGNTIEYLYNENGQFTSVTDNFASLSFTYDSRGRITSSSNAGTPNAPTVELSYAYDDAGNRLSVSELIEGEAGALTSYTYDARNLITRITQSGGGSLAKRVDYTYDALGRWTQLDRFADLNGTQSVASTTAGYDALSRTTSLVHTGSGGQVNAFTYVYDAGNRITSLTSIDGQTTYSYNLQGQLTGALHADAGNADESYSYDALGNRQSTHLAASHTTGAGNRLLNDGTFSYTYDDVGNMTRRTTLATGAVRDFTYDHQNRLTAVTDRNSVGGAATQTVGYTYDGLGRRIAQSVDSDGAGANPASVTHYILDGGQVTLEFVDADGSGPGEPALSSRNLFGPGIDRILVRDDGTQARWHLTDVAGTTHDLVDHDGALVNHLKYDSFGRLIAQSNAAMSTSYQFGGREFDSATGLHYLRARYYDAGIGRFISRDPSGFAGGDANLYRYAGNSPVNHRDPSGRNSSALTAENQAILNQIIVLLSEDFEFNFTVDSIFSPINDLTGGLLSAGMVRNVAFGWPSLFYPDYFEEREEQAMEQFVCTGIAALGENAINAAVANLNLPAGVVARTISRTSPAHHSAIRVDFPNGQAVVLDYHRTLDPTDPSRETVDEFCDGSCNINGETPQNP
jgi:RHS repeat-associated protein